MQVPPTQNNPAAEGGQSAGMRRAPTDDASLPVANLWSAFPPEYRPILAAFHPILVNEHDRLIGSLLSAAPDRVRLPPISSLPTSPDDEYAMWNLICVEMISFALKARIGLIKTTPPVRITLDHVFLALAVFRQPSNIDGTVLSLLDALKKMLDRFREFAVSCGITFPLGPCEYPELAAADMKSQVAKALARRYPLDNEAKWLYALLRALGNIPELWGYQAPNPRSDDTPAAHDGAGHVKEEGVASVEALSTSGPSVDSSPGAQGHATVEGASAPQPTLTPSVPPKGPEIPTGQTYPFLYYQGPNSTNSNRPSRMFGPQPLPNVHAPATTGDLPVSSDQAGLSQQYRQVNASLQSVASTSSKASAPRASLGASQRRVSQLEEILQIERERITGLEHLRDISQNITEFFFRGLFTQYSHQFMGSQMSPAYSAAVLRAADVMVPMVKRFCQHMETDVAILSELGKV